MSIWFTGAGKTDLDNLLELRNSGDPQRANVGFKDAAGNDMAVRYLPASEGDPGPSVGFYTGAGKTDVGPLFCAKGTRVTVNADLGNIYSSHDTGPQSGNVSKTIYLEFNTASAGGSGWFAAVGGNNNNSYDNPPPSYEQVSWPAPAQYGPVQWLEGGNPNDYEIRFSEAERSVPTTSPTTSYVSGTFGSWVSLGGEVVIAARAYADSGSNDTNTTRSYGTYQIRKKGTTTVLASGEYRIKVTASNITIQV